MTPYAADLLAAALVGFVLGVLTYAWADRLARRGR